MTERERVMGQAVVELGMMLLALSEHLSIAQLMRINEWVVAVRRTLDDDAN